MDTAEHTLPERSRSLPLDAKLAAYLAAAASAAASATQAGAAVVAHTTPQPIGVNGEVSIDFNSDGQIDFQIDHDRVNLNGNNLDYLQVDKSDINGAANPTTFDSFLPDLNYMPFPENGTPRNSDAEYLNFTNSLGDGPGYAVALKAGDIIGGTGIDSTIAGTKWDWQEGNNVYGNGVTSRANRLIDEDAGQIDIALGDPPPASYLVPVGANGDFPTLDDFIGLNGETRYVGVRIDLNDALEPGLNQKDLMKNPNVAQHFYYGWIGVQITNEADATGVVTGWAYESTPGMSIVAGDTGPVMNADFDNDGDVDGADFLIWQRQVGSSVTAGTGADGNGDGMVNGADLTLWKNGFGMPPAAPVGTAVPEPGSLALSVVSAALMLIGLAFARRRRRVLATC